MARAVPLLLLIALALPSANFQFFDGLPFTHAPEFLGFVLLLPLIVGRTLRRLHARWLASWPRATQVAIGSAAGVAVGIKLLLLASGASQGFLACYRTPLEPPVNGPCERSFENPFFRFSVTRLDPTINFGEYDWDLGLLNSVRFDPHYDGPQGRLRRRLPIEAVWRGEVERPEPWMARIAYVGEATVSVYADRSAAMATETTLAPRYGSIAVALVPIPAGRHTVRISYRFDDGSTWGGSPPEGPWATLRIERGRGPGGREPGAPVTPIRPPWPWRAAAAVGDVALALLAATLLLFYVGLLWRDAWLLVLLAAVVPLVNRFDPALIGVSSSLGLCLVLALVAAPVLSGRRWRPRLVAAFFALVYVCWFVTLRTFRRLGVVTLRDWAEDPLFYESHARSILETWSLQGGEDVFRYLPLFRYVRFAERLVLGEGDGLVSILALAALYWALCWALARLWPRPQVTLARRLLFGVVAFWMLALASSPPIVFFTQVSLSEYPTWIFLPLLFPLLIVSRSPRDWLRGAALVSLSCLTRLNQIPALLAVMAVFALRAWRIRRGPTLAAVGLVLAALWLPTVHNLYYGGQFVGGTASQGDPVNTVLPLGTLLRFFHDSDVRARVWYQVDHMFYLHDLRDKFPRGEYVSWAAIHSIQLLWLAAGLWTLARRAAPATTRWLLGLPLVYLGVHLMFVVDFYYPRHIIAGHLAMGLVTLYAVGRGFGREPAPE